MTRLLRLLQCVAKRRATDKALILKGKSLAVALLQRSRRVLAGSLNSPSVAKLKPGEAHPWKTVQQRNSGRFQ